MTTTPHHAPGSITRLRNYFLTGFIITAPLVITIYLIWTFVQWVDSWIIPYVPDIYNPSTYLPWDVPGIGLLIAIFIITMIGFLTANIIGRTVVGYGERILGRMPLIRNIYNGLKQIFQTVLAEKGDSFSNAGLIEFPRKGLYALVFISADAKGEIAERLTPIDADMVSCFMPTTPNPTSGFLVFIPRNDIIMLDMSIEDAAKLVISAGLVTPERAQAKLRALAVKAKADPSPVVEAKAETPAPAKPRRKRTPKA